MKIFTTIRLLIVVATISLVLNVAPIFADEADDRAVNDLLYGRNPFNGYPDRSSDTAPPPATARDDWRERARARDEARAASDRLEEDRRQREAEAARISQAERDRVAKEYAARLARQREVAAQRERQLKEAHARYRNQLTSVRTEFTNNGQYVIHARLSAASDEHLVRLRRYFNDMSILAYEIGEPKAEFIVMRDRVAKMQADRLEFSPTKLNSTRDIFIADNPSGQLGQVIGDGECVAFTRQVAAMPPATEWRKGMSVRGMNNIPRGTVIATFNELGRYGAPSGQVSQHAAIYDGQDANGIWVYDQWRGQAVNRRQIRFQNGRATRASNDGDLFYVVNK